VRMALRNENEPTAQRQTPQTIKAEGLRGLRGYP